MTSILKDLKDYLRTKPGDHLPDHEMLRRLIEKVNTENLDERDVIIDALAISQGIRLQELYKSLEIATRNRRELQHYFKVAIDEAAGQRDALTLVKLQRLQKTLDNPPDSARTVDQTTVELALKVWAIQAQHPNWTLKDVAVKHFKDIGEYEHIKKATQRVRKAIKQKKIVP